MPPITPSPLSRAGRQPRAESDSQALSKAEWERAHKALAQWKQAALEPRPLATQAATPHATLPCCPLCAAAGLVIEDRSARPYAEWYNLSCPACGLDANLNVPLAPAFGGSV